MKAALLIICLLPMGRFACGQANQPAGYFHISYFGLLGTHPGLKFGWQYPIINFQELHPEQRSQQLLAGVNGIFYYHRRNHIGLGFDLELGFRNRKSAGMNKEVAIGMGYLWSFLPGKLIDFDRPEPGNHPARLKTVQLLKTASIGLGRQMDGRVDANFWMIRPTLMHLRPFNTGSTFNFAIDAGWYFK